MTSEEFASKAGNLVRGLQTRITGIGDKQYSMGSSQKFEQMGFEEIVAELREELLDCMAYVAMLYINTEALETAAARLDRGK